jgi:hypothetical protein
MDFDDILKLIGRLYLESQGAIDALTKQVRQLQDEVNVIKADKTAEKKGKVVA